MPPLSGFSDNPFRTRSEVRLATITLLRSVCQYQSPGGARIRLPVATGTHFDETAAQLEGFARPLWAVGALLEGSGNEDDEVYRIAQPFVRGLANGTDPTHSEYWGPVVVRDQRMVEMEIISYALLAAPDLFYRNQTPQIQKNIIAWLDTINGKDMPTTNWLWFRVMTNLALIQVCGCSAAEHSRLIQDDLIKLDKFYLDQGWASDGIWSDGIWSDEGRQADYYSGSFAIQFSQLLYVKYNERFDPERCQMYRNHAYQFAVDFWRYFDRNGAAIPFGRSLTYRFAMAGFWSAAALVGIELPDQLNDRGILKGIIFRHMRYWASKSDIFNVDGTMCIGFAYPNMYMCENYNSPQSVYWCMKTLVIMAISSNNAFWSAEEMPLPSGEHLLAKPIKPPMHIVCDSGSHHFLLSSGQYCPWPLKATEAKYGKFAYSSHFGFSVPTGPLLEQTAPDSTLALSKDGGDTWKVRWVSLNPRFGTATLVDGQSTNSIPVLLSSWKPWRSSDVIVSTILIPPTKNWPDWYIRLHEIRATGGGKLPDIQTVDGGFAVVGRKVSDGLPVPSVPMESLSNTDASTNSLEISSASDKGAIVCSSTGVSGIQQIRLLTGTLGLEDDSHDEGDLMAPDANTNLMWSRTVIPVLKRHVRMGKERFQMGVGIYARKEQGADVLRKWCDLPRIQVGGESLGIDTPYILVNGWQ